MTRNEVMDALVRQRTFLNQAINELNLFTRVQGELTTVNRTRRVASIKALALAGDVDVSAWDGR